MNMIATKPVALLSPSEFLRHIADRIFYNQPVGVDDSNRLYGIADILDSTALSAPHTPVQISLPKPATRTKRQPAELTGFGAFTAALKRVMSASGPRSIIPILECVLLESRCGCLTLTCTDMDAALVESIAAPGLPDMRVAVPAKLLFNVLKNLPPVDPISYSETTQPTNKTDGVLKIGNATLATRHPDDFPKVTPGAFKQTFTLPAATLLGALNSVKLGISTEETRYYLNGVHFCIRDDKLLLVSTDGHRLFCKSLPRPDGLADINLILPRLTVDLLLLLLAKRTDNVVIDVSGTRMRFSLGAVQLTTKLIDGSFPEFDRVIPRQNNLKVVFDTSALAGAVKAVKDISKERSQPFNIDLGPDYCRISASHPESGTSVRDVTPLETVSFTVKAGFQARYMLDTLSCIDGPMQITFRAAATKDMADPGAPILIASVLDESWLSVIMPMRI